jgi:hypothetical protein
MAGATAAIGYGRPDVAFVPIRDVPDSTMYLLRATGSRVGPLPELERLAVRVARREAERYGVRQPTPAA